MTPGELGVLFMGFGAFGLLGNVLMSRYIDRVGAPLAVFVGLALMAVSLLAFPLGTSLLLAVIVNIPWGLGCFSTNSAQQARLVGIAPPLAAASVALNSSAIYAGQALGAGGGGWLIAQGGLDQLHWAGFAVMLVGMASSVLATRYARQGR
jgi:predicted MFS family arabinose efflux permease